MLFNSLKRSVGAALALASGLASACPGMDHEHGLAPRSSRYATQPSGGTNLLRPLVWGDFNVVHTTDIHGWYQGHLHSTQPDPNYSGDFGDFASFVAHLRKLAKRKGVDLLISEGGDLHDGNGLSDSYPKDAKPAVDGHVSNQIHAMVKYDLLTVGNHELYVGQVAYDTYKYFVPACDGRYLASNVNISLYDPEIQQNRSRPMGDRYVKFRTDLGRKVTSLGVLFNFTGQDEGLTVQDPADMVKEAWFADAITERPDVFLLAGHMPVVKDQWPVVVSAIRQRHPTTPILILGGHTHIRDCTTYDEHSVGLESGRYLETIGWLSANLSTASSTSNLSFSRTYIDANRRNYAYHLGLSKESKLDTPKGKAITAAMTKIASDWNLTKVYGEAPQDYYLDRVGSTDNSSLLNLLTADVLPTIVSTSNSNRSEVANFVLLNSGAQRFDIYAGNFTKNDQYIVSPFLDAFLFIKDVPWKYASQILDGLNDSGTASSRRRRSSSGSEREAFESDAQYNQRRQAEREAYARGEVEHIFRSWRAEQYERGQAAALSEEERRDLEELDARASASLVRDEASGQTLGYVTKDSCGASVGNGDLGDDTAHSAIPYASVPDYVASPLTLKGETVTRPADGDLVDVVFVDFIASYVVDILNGLQSDRKYTTSEAAAYNTITTQDLYPLYAEKFWQ